MAYQTVDAVRAMEEASGVVLEELKADGGAVVNGWLMKFQADVLGVPVVRPQVLETTALGAAYLAGLAVGYWKGDGEIVANWKVDRRFEPKMPRERVAELRAGWEKAVGRARDWV
jgi:glycerol kinase